MNDPIVVVEQIQKIYENGTEALKSISFEVDTGEIFGLIGVNGAGKTTLIRILTTMLRPTGGFAKVGGMNPVDEPEKVRSIIGVLPQEAGLYEEFTVRENLQFIAEMQGVPKHRIQDRIYNIAEMMGIEDRLNMRADALSGGLKQRTMIGRTLIGDPKVLFLDEPTAGLDVLVARKVRQTIKQLSERMTIFIATHNMHEAYQLCDRVAIIKNGTILQIASPQELMEQYSTSTQDFEDVIAELLGLEEMKDISTNIDVLSGDN